MIPVLTFMAAAPIAALQDGNRKEPPGKVIPVNIKQLYSDVHKLASILPARNYKNPSSMDRAAEYIFKRFRQYTGRVEFQEFTVEGNSYKNVIASFGPGGAECSRVVVGAHYDVFGDQPGADDNASGTAAILQLAALFSRLKPQLNHRIDLVAYALEEPPLFRTPNMGSAVHAGSLAKAGVKVRLMISLDMIGVFPAKAEPYAFTTPFITPGNYIPGNTTGVYGKKGEEHITRILAKYMREYSGISVLAINPPEGTEGIDYSDHLNFWKHGYRAVMITNFFLCPSPHYHNPEDTIDRLDFDKIAEIVKGLYGALCRVSAGDTAQ
jgi:hypothetical protein